MTRLAEHWLIPGLAILAEWSIRWGLVIGAVMAWLVVRPPRCAATRHGLCLAALAAGVMLPLSPRWGEAAIPWPERRVEIPAPREVVDEMPPPLEVGLPPRDGDDRDGAAVPGPHPVPASIPVEPQPRPRQWPEARVIAATAAAFAWGAVVLAMLARLAVGWLRLVRIRREAEASGRISRGLLDECRGAMGLSRRVGLASHPSLRSPAVVGGWRPIVLVPTDWGDWPESRRRACLLHELAHLARYDDWARLAQELVRAPFFFHPLVYWLLARLDRERELLCDEAAVRLGSDPIAYARLLLDLARRPGRFTRAIASPLPGWLPFLDRRTIPVRITRLLEDDMPSTLSRPSAGRTFLVVGLALAEGLIVGGLRVRAGSAALPQSPAPADTRKAAAVPPEKTLAELRGVVVDPDGHPVAGLPVAAAIRDHRWSTRTVLTTDAQGRFSWRLPPGTHGVECFTARDGFVATYGIRSSTDPIDRGDVRLVLHKAIPFSATLADAAGKPIAGATVRVEMIAHAFEEGNRRGAGYTYVRRQIVAGTPLERLVTTTTDAAGAFTFRLAGPDSGLKIAIEARGSTMRIRPRLDLTGHTRRTLEESGFTTAPPGETTRLVALPGARVAGRVVTRLPGVRISGLKATYQESHPPGGRYRAISNFGDEVTIDADGRFTFEGLFEGTVNVFVHGDDENREWT